MEYNWYIIGSQFSIFVGTPPFILKLVTEKQINTLLAESKIVIPVISMMYRAVADYGTSLKEIMDTAKKEKTKCCKGPSIEEEFCGEGG